MTPLIDKAQAAAMLGISPLSINRVMRDIPFVRVGARRVLFDPEDIRAYIERRKVQPMSRRSEEK